MGREKTKRNLVFKPAFKEFVPQDKAYCGVTTLLDEEIEALYLMDILDLYQEDAAISMEVSRPTFTRILKNARQKLTKSLVYGHKLLLQDDDLSYIVAICSSSLDSFENITPAEQYIHIYKVDEDEITLIKAFENDVFLKKLKPAIVLPQIFMKFNVNIFLSRRVGEGLKNSLLAKGIQIIEKDVKTKDDLKGLLSF